MPLNLSIPHSSKFLLRVFLPRVHFKYIVGNSICQPPEISSAIQSVKFQISAVDASKFLANYRTNYRGNSRNYFSQLKVSKMKKLYPRNGGAYTPQRLEPSHTQDGKRLFFKKKFFLSWYKKIEKSKKSKNRNNIEKNSKTAKPKQKFLFKFFSLFLVFSSTTFPKIFQSFLCIQIF